MLEKLKVKDIYDDFLNKVTLTERQKQILNLSIQGKSPIQISMDINYSERIVHSELHKLRSLFNNYKRMEIQKTINLIC